MTAKTLTRKERAVRAEEKIGYMKAEMLGICISAVKHNSGASSLMSSLDVFIAIQERNMPTEKHLIRRSVLGVQQAIDQAKQDMQEKEERKVKADTIAANKKK